jgi:hypothetical protein
VEGQLAKGLDSPLQIGDLNPGLQPEVRTMGTLWWPMVYGRIPTNATDARRVRADARTYDQAVGFFGEYVSLDCGEAECDATNQAWILGADARLASDGQPMAKLPSLSMHAGLSCVASDARGDFDLTRCGTWDAYALWLSVRLRPSMPPALPWDHLR